MAQVDTTFLQFEQRAIAAGNGQHKDVDFALLTPMGANGPIEREVNEQLLDDWRRQGLTNRLSHYEAWKKGQEVPLDGFPIKEWPVASPAEIKACLGNKIFTVQMLAAASSEVLKRLGMGGVTLQNKAKNWLNDEKGKLVEKVANLEAENASLKERLSSIEEEIESLKERAGEAPRKYRKKDAA